MFLWKEEQNRGKANWEHLNEELHVLITVEDTRNRAEMKLAKAVEEVKRLLIPAVSILTHHWSILIGIQLAFLCILFLLCQAYAWIFACVCIHHFMWCVKLTCVHVCIIISINVINCPSFCACPCHCQSSFCSLVVVFFSLWFVLLLFL